MPIYASFYKHYIIIRRILRYADLPTLLAFSATSKEFRASILKQLFSHALISATASGTRVLDLSVPTKRDDVLFITRRRYTAKQLWAPHVWGSLHTLDLDLRHCQQEDMSPLTDAVCRFDPAPQILRRIGRKAISIDCGVDSAYVVDFNDEVVRHIGGTTISMLARERRHYLHLAVDQGGGVASSGRIKLDWPDALSTVTFTVILWPYETGRVVSPSTELWEALDGLVDVVLRHSALLIVGLERFNPEAVVSSTRERSYGPATDPVDKRFMNKLRARWATKLKAYQHRRELWFDLEDPMRWVTCLNWNQWVHDSFHGFHIEDEYRERLAYPPSCSFDGEEESSVMGLAKYLVNRHC